MKKLLVIVMALAMMLTLLVACDSANEENETGTDAATAVDTAADTEAASFEETTADTEANIETDTEAGSEESTEADTEAGSEGNTEMPADPTSPEGVMEQAHAATMASPYRIVTSIKFSSENAEMNQIFSMLNMEYPVVMDGNNLFTSISMDLGEGMKMETAVTLADSVLYYDVNVAGTVQKMKATLNAEQLERFLAENGNEMPVSPAEFTKLNMEKKDNAYIITCDGLTDDGKKILDELMGESVQATNPGATVEMKSLSYMITIGDGKYDSIVLSTEYAMTVEGITVNTKMDASMIYQYNDVPEIKAPADADAYIEVPAEQLIG